MSDQAIRKEAIQPQHSYIVQAPAGSGKTSLLTQRFLALLTKVDRPESILAMTFTKKAAQEMKARILEAIQLSQRPRPDKTYEEENWLLAKQAYDHAIKQGWALEQLGDTLSIMTIDAFCAKIVSTQPLSTLDSNIHPYPHELYEEACQKALGHEHTPHEANAWQTLLSHCDYQEQKLIHLLTQLLCHRDQWLPVILQCRHQEDFVKTLELDLQRLEKQAIDAIHSHTTIPALLKCLEAHPDMHHLSNGLSHKRAAWRELAALCLTKAGKWRKTLTVKQGFPSKGADPEETKLLKLAKSNTIAWLNQNADNSSLKNALEHLLLCPTPSMDTKQKETLHALTVTLPLIAAHAHLIFKDHQACDFIEISSTALAILQASDSENATTQALDGQLMHLLVDEFQDTSPSQFKMLECLLKSWQPNGHKSLFLVGDPMQSIYRFRQAEVALFIRAQQQGIGPVKLKPLQLTSNFRQAPVLVDWINSVMAKTLGQLTSERSGCIAFNPSIAQSPDTENTAITQEVGDDRNIEINRVVSHIQSLQQTDPKASIAVLAKARKHLQPLINALHTKQIPFNSNEIESITQSPGCIDLVALATTLVFPHHHTAWFSVLRSPFCGLSLNTIEAHYDALSPLSTTSMSSDCIECTNERQHYDRLVQHISDARLRLQTESFQQLFEHLAFSLGGAAHPDITDQLLTTVSHIANELYQSHWHHPQQLEDRLSSHYLKASSVHPLTLMTCHKAKGLEYDHIILPFTDKKSPPKQHSLLLWQEKTHHQPFIISPMTASDQDQDPIYHYLYRSEIQKESHEHKRVFYVACTRAKKSLYFSATKEEDKQFSQHSFASWLPDKWQSITQCHAPYNAESAQQMIRIETTNPIQAPPIHTPDTIVSLPLAQKLRGLCLHASLELLSQQTQEQWLREPQLHYQIWQHIFYRHGQVKTTLFDDYMQTLRQSLCSSRLQWILSEQPTAYSEYALSYKQNNQIKRCIIDRLLILEDTLWIIDYKTGLFFRKRPENLLQYQEQLNSYAKVLKKDKIIKCGLYFIDNDDWLTWEYQEEASVTVFS